MIELTEQQRREIEGNGNQIRVLNPATKEEYVLVHKDVYESMQRWMKSLKRGWDNPADDDLTRKPT